MDEMQISEIKRESNAMLERARELSLNIKDDITYEEACAFRILLNKAKRERKDKLEPIRASAYATYKKTLALIDEILSPFETGIEILDMPIVNYQDERERQKLIEEERLRKIAKNNAEAAQLEAAIQAESAGDDERAEAILNQEPIITRPNVQSVPKVENIAYRVTWSASPIVNMRLLVKAIHEGKAQIELVSPNMQALNGLARALKDKMNIPGVSVVREKIISSRTK